jgi:hypothetical protein
MAAIHKWLGEDLTFTFNGKAKDSSAITSVVVKGDDVNAKAGKGPFDPQAYWSDAYSGLDFHDLVQNAGAGATKPTLSVGLTYYECPSGAAMTTYVIWGANSGELTKISSDFVYVYKPATSLTVTPSSTNIWNDGSYTIKAAPNNEITSGRLNSTSAAVSFTSNNTGVISSTSGKTNTNTALTIVKTGTINKSAVVTMTASHTGGAAATTSNLSKSSISGSKQITVKNAVKSVNITESTLYVSVNETITFSYSVTPLAPGEPYSYTMDSISATNATNLTLATKTAIAKGTNGVINVTGNKVGTSVVTLSSSQASAKKSDTITIYVTPANTAFYLNVGDIKSIVIGDIPVTAITKSTNADNYVTLTKSGTSLLIKCKSATPTDNPVKLILPGDAEISVTITNLTLTLS